MKIKLWHGNCFCGCFELVGQGEDIWKIFFVLFLSRLVSLQSQLEGQYMGLDIICGPLWILSPGPFPCLAQQTVDVLVVPSLETELLLS